jgi:predicted acyltransferase
MKNFGLILLILVVIIYVVLFIYGMYWIAKTVSYKVFYKDMVRATITEMVKPGSLR